MGIHGLTKLLGDAAPAALRGHGFETYFGRRVAIDASMHIYQFLIVVGRQGDQVLTNEAGEVTAHLQGMFMRTARLLQAGIKPVYVFDGKPPEMKGGELQKRLQKRAEAEAELKAAREAGDQERVEKLSKRTQRATRAQSEQCKRLLRLMGVPVVQATCEAEATCARMQAAGRVYAVSTEDMDALTFGTLRLARHMMAPASQKKDVLEFSLEAALRELQLSMPEFIDLCILMGCDYCDTIRGIGPVRALQLMRKHRSIEEIVKQLDPAKYPVPEGFLESVQRARVLFSEPDVTEVAEADLKWSPPDREGLLAFLVDENQFQRERVVGTLDRLSAARKEGKGNQNRLDSFFGAAKVKTSTVGKRKEPAGKRGGAVGKGPAAKRGGKFGVGKKFGGGK